MLNKHYLRWAYTSEFIATTNYYAQSLRNKVLPAFEDISEDAKKVAEDAYNQFSYSGGDPEWLDPGDIAEHITKAEISFFIMSQGVVQGVINMFAAGLYHLFEQQLLRVHRQELLFGVEETDSALFNVKTVQQRLVRDYSIDIYTFTAWNKLEELRLVANTVKHADGASCDKLKQRRPDLFFATGTKDNPWPPDILACIPVYEPLTGEDLYISPEEFIEYADATKQFWEELTQAVGQLPD